MKTIVLNENILKDERVCQVLVEKLDINSLFSFIKGLDGSEISESNKIIAKVLMKQFEPKFGNYLYKELMKNIKSGSKKNGAIDLLSIIANYAGKTQDNNKDEFEQVFDLIGMPMMNYFIRQTFGMKNFIRSVTPFMKTVSTGNREIDIAIRDAMVYALDNEEAKDEFLETEKHRFDDYLQQKLAGVLDDQQVFDMIKSANSEEELEDESIDEGVNDAISYIKDKFKSKESRDRIKVVDTILGYMPKLKPSIRRSIQKEIMDEDYAIILKLQNVLNENYLNKTVIKNYVVEPLINHVIKQSQNLYFKEKDFKEFTPILVDVFKDPTITHLMSEILFFRIKDIFDTNKKQEKNKIQKKLNKKRR